MLIEFLDERFGQVVNIPKILCSVCKPARSRTCAHKPTAMRQYVNELCADGRWIRPKIECVDAQQFIELLFSKWQVGNIAAHEDEFVVFDGYSITPRCCSYDRW